MDNNKLQPINNLTYALNLIKFMPQALLHHVDALSALRQRLQELDGRTCTGHPHWRDKNTEGKTAKMYILHGTDQICSIHGTPRQGERTRSYIGNKPDKISAALAAIERETERQDLQKDLRRLQGTITHVIYQLQALYRRLDHIPPDAREQRPAMPNENVRMKTE